MIAADLLSENIYPAKGSDNLATLLDRMHEYHVVQLPLVKKNQLVGLIHENDVATLIKDKNTLKGMELPHELVFVYETQHVYDVIRLFHIHQLDVLPVLDQKHQYVGVITLHDLINNMAVLTASNEAGGIIILEVNNRDNALSHIAQIVESDNAQIMSSFVRTFPDSTRMEITIKLNRTDIASIVAAFLRYDYTVKATFNDARVYDTSQERYDQLMNYLNM